jgi:hypothetical protein
MVSYLFYTELPILGTSANLAVPLNHELAES